MSISLLRRVTVRAVMAGLLTTVPPLSSPVAQAADWPARPLRLIVPYPPGGGADMIGRYYADKLGVALGQPVVVENRPGAGTTIAGANAARSAADGYTLSLATVDQLTIAPHLYAHTGYDALNDFEPIATLASTPMVVASGAKRKIETFDEIQRLARQAPGKISFSSCSAASLCHLAGELLQQKLGIELLHVPYKGSAPAIQGLLGGDTDLSVDTQLILAPQIKAGKARGLVILASQRSQLLPDVPSAPEVGLKDIDVQGWYGVVVPKGTPQPIVDRLSAETRKIAESPATAERLQAGGLSPYYVSGAAYRKLIVDGYGTWQQIIQQTGLKLD